MRVVGADLQALINLRNSVARRAGFDNYWELGLASQGLTVAEVTTLTDELAAIVQPIVSASEAQVAAHADRRDREHVRQPDDDSSELGLEGDARMRTTFLMPTLRKNASSRRSTTWASPQMDGRCTRPSRYTRSGVYGFPVRPPNSIAIVMSNDRRWTLWQYEAMAYGVGAPFGGNPSTTKPH